MTEKQREGVLLKKPHCRLVVTALVCRLCIFKRASRNWHGTEHEGEG